VNKARNYIDSLAPEIEEYFITNKIPLEKWLKIYLLTVRKKE
jgi:hypothetical protein